jgi:hypothetical protein
MLSVAALIAVDTAQTDVEMSFNQVNSDRAFYVAEAGIQRAFQEIRKDDDWRTGFLKVQFADGEYSVAVVDSTGIPNLQDTIVLRSTGVLSNGVANLEAWIAPEYNQPFKYALYADSSIFLENNTCTDSYNSDSGSYYATRLTEGGDIGSNGTILMENSASVGGDALAATDGGITMDNSSNVAGDTVSGVPKTQIEPIPQEDFDSALLVNSAPSGFSGSYKYNSGNHSLSLSGSDVLELSGGTYYFSDITLNNQASIRVAPGEQVTIYMTGDLYLNQSSSLNFGEPAANMLIYSNGETFKIGQTAQFSAAFYGPNAHVSTRNNTDLFGAIVSKSISIENYSCFHYDRTLSKLNAEKTGEMLMVAWREL